MVAKTITYAKLADPIQLATQISGDYIRWKNARSPWEKEKEELRSYIFARDTSTTTNKSLPWKNTTATPKLCQIRDNLHANYMATMFTREDWFDWVPGDESSATKQKASAIRNYMKSKLRASDFKSEISKLVLDYIDVGNAFAEIEHEKKYHTTPDGQRVKIYVGPKLRRLSPFDFVFDITAPDFDSAAKITRRLYTLGDLKKMEADGIEWAADAFNQATDIRAQFRELGCPDIKKYSEFALDGLGDITNYYRGAYVEILEFEGDAYDPETKQLLANHRIIVVDRRRIASKKPYASWLGRSNKKHVGWRLRPESLLAMGPLDNLVGLQYRIDHLENLKADVFDQIAFPVVYQKGNIEDWDWGPGARIFGDTESDVRVLSPDATALNANFEIANIMNLMEEMAGAPKQAAGFRTPGEKTAYEVQSLENAAARIFQNKIQHFEATFVEPLLNDMLEAARRNLDLTEQIAVQDTDLGVTEFRNISAEDIKANGKLVPMGSRHFAEQANQIQTLNAFMSSPMYQDQAVNANISGFGLALHFNDLLKLPAGVVRKGVRVIEAAETQKLIQAAQASVQDNAAAGVQIAAADQVAAEQVQTEG